MVFLIWQYFAKACACLNTDHVSAYHAPTAFQPVSVLGLENWQLWNIGNFQLIRMFIALVTKKRTPTKTWTLIFRSCSNIFQVPNPFSYDFPIIDLVFQRNHPILSDVPIIFQFKPTKSIILLWVFPPIFSQSAWDFLWGEHSQRERRPLPIDGGVSAELALRWDGAYHPRTSVGGVGMEAWISVAFFFGEWMDWLNIRFEVEIWFCGIMNYIFGDNELTFWCWVDEL